jgi:hypothetical protein
LPIIVASTWCHVLISRWNTGPFPALFIGLLAVYPEIPSKPPTDFSLDLLKANVSITTTY